MPISLAKFEVEKELSLLEAGKDMHVIHRGNSYTAKGAKIPGGKGNSRFFRIFQKFAQRKLVSLSSKL